MSDWQDLDCGCQVRKRPNKEANTPWNEWLSIKFCPQHSGNYDKTTISEAPAAPIVKENLTVAPVAEPPKPKKAKAPKQAERKFPFAIYSDEDLNVTEFQNEVTIRRRTMDDFWKSEHYSKSELTIIAAAWVAAHKESK